MAMDFLYKTPEVAWRAFFLILFIVGYVATVTTVLAMCGKLESVGLFIGVLLLTALTLMTFAFGFSRLVRRTDIIDMMWGTVIVVLAIASLLANPYGVGLGMNVQTVATALVSVWGIRLSYHIARRLLRTPEDPRYKQLRKKWRGNDAINTYLRVFVVQAVLAVCVASSVICINMAEDTEISAVAWVGIAIWGIGFLFEAIGDWQLKRFLTNAKTKNALMTRGLWRYTRHPNYFGEATMWWGVGIIALAQPIGWMGLLSPVIITYLLLYVSGVPLAEKRAEKKAGWKAYSRRTSKFVPLLPRE